MSAPLTTDVVVVGGGMAGASVAWELSRRGAGVVLLEAETQPGVHSTGRSAAVLTETTGPPAVRTLAAESRRFLEDPPVAFADSPLVSTRQVLWVARPSDVESLLAAARAWQPQHGVDVIDEAAARALVPSLRPGYAAAAVVERTGLDIDVDGLLQAYLRGARRQGATVLTGAPVTSAARDAGGWRVETPTGTVRAAVVVDAAGAWADDLARAAGVAPVGLVPMRRTAFVFPPPPTVDTQGWPLVMDAGDRFYVKPEPGLLLASPCDETPTGPGDVRADELDVARGVDRLHEAFTFEVRGVRRAWAGLRTFAADRAPVAGADTDAPGFVWAAGQGGYGIKIAPALAALVAAAALGQQPPAALAGVVPATDPARLRARHSTC